MPTPRVARTRSASSFRCASFLLLLVLCSRCSADRIQDLRKCVGGGIPVYSSGNQNYDRLKTNSFVNNFAVPVAIAEALNEFQVSRLVKCAQSVSIRVCARSGGHSLIGHNQCKGLLIDLAKMRKVSMQPGGVALIEPGAVMGEVLWNLHKSGRWMAAGVCPNVGFAGYVLGGGHGPYEGRLGLACDSMLSLRLVDRFGKILVVSSSSRAPLFWGMCGGGGGQFGIVTAFRWRTAASGPFDRSVVFRFLWPKERGGELIEKWQNFGEFGGNVWFRIEIRLENTERGVAGYGACYEVKNVQECLNRLNQAPFFRTPGRVTKHTSFTGNALAVHAFFGPEGGWGNFRAPNLFSAMLNWRGKDYGSANDRIYQSTFLRMNKKPSKSFWQKYVNFCQKPGSAASVPWVVCEMNLFNNAVDKKRKNAFAFRAANVITHYIVGGGSQKDKDFAYKWMRGHFKKFTMGVYVNYPELELKKKYAKAYWGRSLKRLQRLKKRYDPKNFFMNPQPIR